MPGARGDDRIAAHRPSLEGRHRRDRDADGGLSDGPHRYVCVEGPPRGIYCASGASRFGVLPQCVQNTAFFDRRVAADIEESFKRRFERPEIGDFSSDFGEMLSRNSVDIGARVSVGSLGQRNKTADRIEREAEFARFTDEGQSLAMDAIIYAVPASASVGFGEHPDLLIIADRHTWHPTSRPNVPMEKFSRIKSLNL